MSHFLLTPVEVSNPVIPVSTFKSVYVTKYKPLVLCDIDDTVIGYSKNFDSFYNELKLYVEKVKQSSDGPANNFKHVLNNMHILNMTDYEIKVAANKRYDEYRLTQKPVHCDFDGFVDLLKRINTLGGELQFLTARSKEASFITRRQFGEIGLNYYDYRVHYTGNRISKGEYIKRYFNLNHFGEVLFIDDFDSYLQSVVDLFPNIKCYKFEYKP